MEHHRLRLRTKLAFGVSDIGGSGLFTLMAFVLMNYLTDQVGMNPALAGAALMIGKIFDAAADPIVGYLSDRTRTRWGRRRPFIFVGALLMAVALCLVLNNPHIQDQGLLFAWAAGVLILLNLAYALINIPYSALTPELTDDFNERTSLNGYRMVFAVIGSFIAAGASMPIVAAFKDPVTGVQSDFGYLVLGLIFAGIILTVSAITILGVKEKIDLKASFEKNIFVSYFKAFQNIPFLLVLVPFIMYITAQTIVIGTLIYYFKYIYFAPEQTTPAMVILLTTTMVFIPVWVQVAKRIGKKYGLSLGMGIVALAGLLVFAFAHTAGMNFMLAMMCLAGIGLASAYVLPWSMLPDTIDYEYAQSGQRREGTYYGIWTFTSKIGQALSALAIGLTLTLTHYVPNQVIQPESAIFGIRLLFGPVMSFFYIVGAIVILFYPIDQKKYEAIQAQIQARDGVK